MRSESEVAAIRNEGARDRMQGCAHEEAGASDRNEGATDRNEGCEQTEIGVSAIEKTPTTFSCAITV